MNESINPSKYILLFTRYPEPGRSKTRLIPELGEEKAAELQKKMGKTICKTLTPLVQTKEVRVEIHYEGGTEKKMQDWLGSKWLFKEQSEGSLGDKLHAAISEKCGPETEAIIVIGSDCPSLTINHIHAAVDRLQNNDVVIGPARDGGYYLIGLKKPAPFLFEGIDWGTDRVFDQTVSKAEEQSLSISFLEMLQDIDRPEDLK